MFIIKRNFSRLISKKSKFRYDTYMAKEMYDPLYFPNKNKEFNGGIEQAILQASRSNNEMSVENISLILYQMGKNEVRNNILEERIEFNLTKFSNNFCYVRSFGSLYGALKLNFKPHLIHFLIDEYKNKSSEISFQDHNIYYFYELISALNHNKSFKLNDKIYFIENNLFPIILENWKKNFDRQHRMLPNKNLIKDLVDLNLYNSEIFKNLIEFFSKYIINNNSHIIKFYELIIELEKKEDLKIDLSGIKSIYEELIKNKSEIKWIYNFKTLSYYTYEEMVDKRENYEYVNQLNSKILGPEFDDIEEKYQQFLENKKLNKEELDNKNDNEMSNDLIIDKINKGEVNFEEDEEELEDEEDYKLFMNGFKKNSHDDFESLSDEDDFN